jgi:hypothetical protein
LPIGQTGAEVGDKAVFFFAAELLKKVLIKLARTLDGGGISGFALKDRNQLEFDALGERLNSGCWI